MGTSKTLREYTAAVMGLVVLTGGCAAASGESTPTPTSSHASTTPAPAPEATRPPAEQTPTPSESVVSEVPSPSPVTITATETVTATQTVTVVPEPTITAPVITQVGLGSTVSMRHFDVTVSDVQWDSDGVAVGVKVAVCYTHAHPDANRDGTTRTSRDPWSFGLLDAESGKDDYSFYRAREFDVSTHWTPVYAERLVSVGECNSGWLGIEHGNPDLWIGYVRYAPSDFGDQVTWNLGG